MVARASEARSRRQQRHHPGADLAAYAVEGHVDAVAPRRRPHLVARGIGLVHIRFTAVPVSRSP